MNTKHPQSILAIESKYFTQRGIGSGVVDFPFQQLYEETPPYIVIGQRGALEMDPSKRQVIGYKVPIQTVDGVQKIVAYRRLATGGESRLYGLMSIGFGGHIDFEDVVTYTGEAGSKERSTINLHDTVVASARREISEELHFVTASGGTAPYEPAPWQVNPADLMIHYDLRAKLGADWDVSKDVHCVHVALVYFVEADPTLTFVSGEPEQIELLPAMTVEELLASGYEMEEWTRLLLEHMAKRYGSDANLLG